MTVPAIVFALVLTAMGVGHAVRDWLSRRGHGMVRRGREPGFWDGWGKR
jgi:hypothetical protein